MPDLLACVADVRALEPRATGARAAGARAVGARACAAPSAPGGDELVDDAAVRDALVGDVSLSDVAVRGVTHDSRAVRPGDLFAALPGEHAHGAAFVAQAVERGAVAVLTDAAGGEVALEAGVPVLVAGHLDQTLGRVCAIVHGDPSASLPVVAVTGTDGKTTTCWLIAHALEALGRPAGLVGSLDTLLGGRVLLHDEPQHRRTTPLAPDLQATLALLRDRGARAVVMEASSHGLAQGRLAGTRVQVAVFTNLGHEHLDFHGDREQYFAAKAGLFHDPTTRRQVVNVDDEHGRRLASQLLADGRQPVTVSASGAAEAHWRADSIRLGPDGTTFLARGPGGDVPVRLALTGRFNVDNALAALAALVALDVEPRSAAAALGRLRGVPGRMQWVPSPDSHVDRAADVRALIDYAHTPGALEALLGTVREVVERPDVPDARVLLVLGTGGGRDASKRYRMGQAAGRGADVVVLTDDNPRHEDPVAIVAALRAGVTDAGPAARTTSAQVVHDRAGAIELAVAAARPGDVVVVAGKGPDRVQLVGDQVLAVDDEQTLVQALRQQTDRAGRAVVEPSCSP